MISVNRVLCGRAGILAQLNLINFFDSIAMPAVVNVEKLIENLGYNSPEITGHCKHPIGNRDVNIK